MTSPALIIPKDSLAKVLNVVKPPQKPVTSNSFISGDKTTLLTKPNSNPISSEPMTFTTNVPQGHEELTPESRYRKTEPNAPPRATNKTLRIIYYLKKDISNRFYATNLHKNRDI